MSKEDQMPLHSLATQVKDQQTFLVFAKALLEDRRQEDTAQAATPIDQFGRGPCGWENHSIEAFLEAAIAWAEDSDFGDSQDLAGASPWRKLAAFLYCGKIYE